MLEIPLINWDVNRMLGWCTQCVISSKNAVNQAKTFTITDTKIYVLVVTLSIEDNVNPLYKFNLDLNQN